jgi:hypothetical protein
MPTLLLPLVLALAIGFATTVSAADKQAEALSPQAAFDKLKALSGEWVGKIDDREKGDPVKVSYKTTSGGTVVAETLFVGTDHEMVTMYFLDKGKLVLVHYCSGGNQPRMKMTEASTAGELVFDFDGGTNLDPAKDMHMHSSRLAWEEGGAIRGVWSAYKDGKAAGAHTFFLKRS